MSAAQPDFRIASVALDEKSVVKRAKEIEQEREVAIRDLLEKNHFVPHGSLGGPYHLILAIVENRLVFDIRLTDGAEHRRVVLSLTPFRRVVKDYFMICESYYAAVRDAPAQDRSHRHGPPRPARRGCGTLRERLERKDRDGYGYRAAAVHADLRAASEGRGMSGDVPGAVLFVCSRNAVRSPMASALMRHVYGSRIYVASAGVNPGEPDSIAIQVMNEMGIDISGRRPRGVDEVEETAFDLVVALAPSAREAAALAAPARRHDGILADARSHRVRGLARDAACRLSRAAGPPAGPHPSASGRA